MKLSEMLAGKPPPRVIPDAPALIRKGLIASGNCLAVVDDDPTGVQTVHGVNVYMIWPVEVLRSALAGPEPVFYVSTNSRGLSPEEARLLSYEVGRNLREASRLTGRGVLLASRSDSTLRGHFPYEVEALTSGLGLEPDGVLIVPAFFEGGRYTVDDIHWVEQNGELVPAHLTEFARDPVFGFRNSNLKDWVAEKTGGAVKAGDVLSISLELLREGGPEAAADILDRASGGLPVIANAACYEDLAVLALGMQEVENRGKKFVYRCAAGFVKARGGFAQKPLLGHRDLLAGPNPGLVVVGSYVEKTSKQLEPLLASGIVRGIEIRVGELLVPGNREKEVKKVSAEIDRNMAAGITTVLYTSREVLKTEGKDFQDTGKIIMSSLCDVVGSIKIHPGYLVAKGGITSIELARTALNVNEAVVLGQILPGVPVLKFGAEARWPDIPYVVFPGNVGDSGALLKVISILKQSD
jgi:uncharacterized protein YgbK (DUF1537 family)